MKLLFTTDLKDYDTNWKKFYRPSVRAIILNKDHKIALIYSNKLHFYKFPGGGIEENEDRKTALAREVKEETGMSLIPDSVEEFGKVLKIQKGDGQTIHIQENFYYRCEVSDEIGEQNLDDNEKDLDFTLKFVSIDEAIKKNNSFKSDDLFKKQISEREKKVLELLKP